MKYLTIAAASLLFAASTPATGAEEEWVGQRVLIHYGADGVAGGGKVVRSSGCLHVRLSEPRGGRKLIRFDEVRRLQVRSGDEWVAKGVNAVLAREPAHCLEVGDA
jgi:hypothetical protein